MSFGAYSQPPFPDLPPLVWLASSFNFSLPHSRLVYPDSICGWPCPHRYCADPETITSITIHIPEPKKLDDGLRRMFASNQYGCICLPPIDTLPVAQLTTAHTDPRQPQKATKPPVPCQLFVETPTETLCQLSIGLFRCSAVPLCGMVPTYSKTNPCFCVCLMETVRLCCHKSSVTKTMSFRRKYSADEMESDPSVMPGQLLSGRLCEAGAACVYTDSLGQVSRVGVALLGRSD
ncbi:hypothetical protein V8C26DRAFT_271231 [Trichoderma gracile]